MTAPRRSLALLVLVAAASSAACSARANDEEPGTSEQHMEQGACTSTAPVSYSKIADEEEADYRVGFHEERGASATKTRNADSTFDVVATYPPNQTIFTNMERYAKTGIADSYRAQGAKVFVIEKQAERWDLYVYLPCND